MALVDEPDQASLERRCHALEAALTFENVLRARERHPGSRGQARRGRTPCSGRGAAGTSWRT